MGRAPCCDKANVKRGPWSPEEDDALRNYVEKHGSGGSWISLPQKAGLKRCGKSCRLRWLNYLRPDIKHGGFTEEEDNIIYTLYQKIGSRWSVMASHLPGRTDNDIKNYWNTKLKKRIIMSQNNLPTTTTAAAASHSVDVRTTSTTPPLIIPTVKIESYNCDDFMAPPPQPPPPPFPEAEGVLLEHSGFNESVRKFAEEGSTTSSSNITVENNNNNISWCTSACGESYNINGFLAEFGLGSPGELLGGYYANLEKKGEHDANFEPFGNMWVTGDTKPKGLFQYS